MRIRQGLERPPTPSRIPIGNEAPSYGHPMKRLDKEAQEAANKGLWNKKLRKPYWRYRADPWLTRLRHATDAIQRGEIIDETLRQTRESDLPNETTEWLIRWVRHITAAVRLSAHQQREQTMESGQKDKAPPPPPSYELETGPLFAPKPPTQEPPMRKRTRKTTAPQSTTKKPRAESEKKPARSNRTGPPQPAGEPAPPDPPADRMIGTWTRMTRKAKSTAIKDCFMLGLVFSAADRWCTETTDSYGDREEIDWNVDEVSSAQNRLRTAKNHTARSRLMDHFEESMSSGSYLWIRHWNEQWKRWGF